MQLTIVSGGQTGVDRAAFDVGLAWGLSTCGWVPRGRLDEEGPIDPKYPNLRETETDDVAVRTALNVRDSDGTLMISHGPLLGGSCRAVDSARELARPLCILDLSTQSMIECVDTAEAWIREHRIVRLNVGGPRHSEDPEIYGVALQLLSAIVARLRTDAGCSTHREVAMAVFADATANFRHWDQLRWAVPSWFITLFAGMAGLTGLVADCNMSANVRVGGLVFGLFGLLCLLLEINLVRYHNATVVSLRRTLDELGIDTRLKKAFSMRLPFRFDKSSIWTTATLWFLLAMIGIICVCAYTWKVGMWWLPSCP